MWTEIHHGAIQYTSAFSEARTEELKQSFANATPFPHVVIDDLLSDLGRSAAAAFPSPDSSVWRRYMDEYQKEKRICSDISIIPEGLRDIIECQQPHFLGFLEQITGLKMLTVDPYLEGGGLHLSGPGGVLTPHTDFHYYRALGLFRKINVLIYLNDNWGPADGGRLELFRKGESEPDASIVPSLGRVVIFRTDDESVHGFSNPVAPGKWRKSIALYYYSTRESAGFAGDTTTHWQAHGTSLRGVRLQAYDGLIFVSRAFSKLAHLLSRRR